MLRPLSHSRLGNRSSRGPTFRSAGESAALREYFGDAQRRPDFRERRRHPRTLEATLRRHLRRFAPFAAADRAAICARVRHGFGLYEAAVGGGRDAARGRSFDGPRRPRRSRRPRHARRPRNDHDAEERADRQIRAESVRHDATRRASGRGPLDSRSVGREGEHALALSGIRGEHSRSGRHRNHDGHRSDGLR